MIKKMMIYILGPTNMTVWLAFFLFMQTINAKQLNYLVILKKNYRINFLLLTLNQKSKKNVTSSELNR